MFSYLHIISFTFFLSFIIWNTKQFRFVSNEQKVNWTAPEWTDTLTNPLKEVNDYNDKAASLYKKICTVCHGPKGNGDGESSYTLAVSPGDLNSKETRLQSDGALFWKISTGKHPMPPYEHKLSYTERWLLVNYTRTLQKNATSDSVKKKKNKLHNSY